MRVVPNYVQKDLDAFEDVREMSDGWLALCPCPTHGKSGKDTRPSIRISIGKNGKVVVICRVGCTTQDVLHYANLRPEDLFCPDGETPMEPLTVPAEELAEAAADLRNVVYRSLLGCLVLSEQHRTNLRTRGLTDAAIDANGYRSILKQEFGRVAKQVQAKYGDLVHQVPGFVDGKYGPTLHGDSGLIFPCRDAQGRVVALKIRRDRALPKYIYLSSPDHSCGVQIHCPAGRPDLPVELVRTTEGEGKADVATLKTNVYTISAPGVSNWSGALPVLRSLGARRVLVAFDWNDVRTKTPVRQQLRAFLDALRRDNYEVGIETWDPAHKGIDDALAAGVQITALWGDDVEAALNPPRPKAPPQPVGSDRSAFPLDVLPGPVETFVRSVAASLQCPADWVALGCLVVAGRALGTARAANLDGKWLEMGNLYGVVVAEPGTMKTSAMNWAMKPVFEYQKELSAQYDHGRQEARDFNRRVRDARARGGPMPEGDAPERFDLEHVYIENATVEATVKILHENQEVGRRDAAVLNFHDELTAWVRLMNAYRSGQGADRNFALALWSGKQIKIDRKMDGSLTIPCPFLAVFGGVQPDLLDELGDSKGRDDGFLDRLIWSYPPIQPVYRPGLVDVTVPDEVLAAWVDLVKFLFLTVRPGREKPLPVRLTDEARREWVDWARAHADEMEAPGFPRVLKGPWSKFRAYFARFALIVHYLRWACGEVGSFREKEGGAFEADEGLLDLTDLQRAGELVAYFKDHCRAVRLGAAAAPEVRLAEDFAEWVKNDKDGSASARDVIRSGRFKVKNAKEAYSLMTQAEDLGLGLINHHHAGANGRKSKRFETADAEE